MFVADVIKGSLKNVSPFGPAVCLAKANIYTNIYERRAVIQKISHINRNKSH